MLSGGTISAANTNFNQDCDIMDALGNQQVFKWDSNGGGNSWTNQVRWNNSANEIGLHIPQTSNVFCGAP